MKSVQGNIVFAVETPRFKRIKTQGNTINAQTAGRRSLMYTKIDVSLNTWTKLVAIAVVRTK